MCAAHDFQRFDVDRPRHSGAPCLALSAITPIIPVSSIVPVPTIVVPLSTAIRAMVVIEPAPVSVPVAQVKLPAVISRPDPPGAPVRRACPVSVVPTIVVAGGIPITIDPEELRSRSTRQRAHHARRWGRADSEAERYLRVGDRPKAEQHGHHQYRWHLFHCHLLIKSYCNRYACATRQSTCAFAQSFRGRRGHRPNDSAAADVLHDAKKGHPRRHVGQRTVAWGRRLLSGFGSSGLGNCRRDLMCGQRDSHRGSLEVGGRSCEPGSLGGAWFTCSCLLFAVDGLSADAVTRPARPAC